VDEGGSEMQAITIIERIPWFGWVAIVAIICGTITQIVKLAIHHRERMEMFRMGMHLDSPAPSPSDEKPPVQEEV
jgi:hypothetical protein